MKKYNSIKKSIKKFVVFHSEFYNFTIFKNQYISMYIENLN